MKKNSTCAVWRRERDSNPRYSFPYNGFRDRHNRPLCHLSGSKAGLNSAGGADGVRECRGGLRPGERFRGGCSEVRGAAKVKNLRESEVEKCSTGVVWGKSNSFGGKLGLEWLPGQS